MSRGYTGQAVPRREDLPLLTGRGRFVGNIVVPGALHMALVRSQLAHARIREVDVLRARRMPGVVAAFENMALARDAMLAEPFLHEKGTLEVPRGPGLGFDIDRRALRKHGKRFFVMDRKRLIFFALRDRGIKAAREMDAAKSARQSQER